MERLPYLLAVAALGWITLWAFASSDPTTAAGGVDVGVRADPSDVYNPVLAGERLPDGFRQLLPRDAITPIYEPAFVNHDAVAWPGETQVIGVASGDQAKAYPVSFLNGREMVVDEIDGIPILVTW